MFKNVFYLIQNQNAFIQFLIALFLLIFIYWIIRNIILHFKDKENRSQGRLPAKITKETYKKYLASDHWKALRKAAIERADSKCELCGSLFNEVHHIKYPNKLKYDKLSNLLVVCNKCHKKLHGIRESDNNQKKVLFSEKIETGTQKFLFEIKIAANGIKYLKISELTADETGNFEKYQIIAFKENIDAFNKTYRKAIKIMD